MESEEAYTKSLYFEDELEFKIWYYSWGNAYMDFSIFDHHKNFILKNCKEFKHVWHEDYFIWELSK
jgi:hypothetical protein|tara:strand:+ start:521 stop:718 length:198 start_codon:yes stop_codon:yes gene_type:complete